MAVSLFTNTYYYLSEVRWSEMILIIERMKAIWIFRQASLREILFSYLYLIINYLTARHYNNDNNAINTTAGGTIQR